MKLAVKTLRTNREKTKGLIGANPVFAVYFTTRWGIHSFGLLFPIDVVILDNSFRVIKIHNLLPNRIYLWNPKYKHVIELPKGEIEKKKITVGCHIKLANP